MTTVNVTSTTDTDTDVQEAMGLMSEGKPAEDTASAPADEAEQKDDSESDTEQAEAKDEQDDSSESESDEDEDKEDDSQKDKPKKKSGFRRRIDKLNARLAAERQQREELESRLARIEKGAGSEKADPVEPRADASGKPDPDSFETHAEYIEAVADWKAEQKLKAHEERQRRTALETEHQRAIEAHANRVRAFAEKTDDFDEVVAEVDDIPVSAAMQELIITSENGPELMYELAKNPEEFERIAKLPPLAAARAIGRIESKLASQASAPKVATKKTTKAPAPIAPVGQKSALVEKDPDQMSYQEFKKWREAQLNRS